MAKRIQPFKPTWPGDWPGGLTSMTEKSKKGGWVTKIERPTGAPGQKTWPIGEELAGFETLTPSQMAVSDPLSAALQKLLATPGGPAFKPQAATAFMPYGGAVGGALQSALMTALRGEVPTAAFERGVAGPARRTFEEETAPAIREEFAGPGTFWGTARAGEVTGRRERMETGIGEQRARMVEGALERALRATGPALTAQQSAIQMAYQEYARRNPAASEALQAALSYLGIPMLGAYQPYEEKKDRWVTHASVSGRGVT